MPVKSKGKISKNFVAFSEYMNFKPQNAILEKFYPIAQNDDGARTKGKKKVGGQRHYQMFCVPNCKIAEF